MSNFDPKCVRLFRSEPKCTDILSEKVPDLSHLGPIWLTLGPNLRSLYLLMTNCLLAEGCQVLLRNSYLLYLLLLQVKSSSFGYFVRSIFTLLSQILNLSFFLVCCIFCLNFHFTFLAQTCRVWFCVRPVTFVKLHRKIGFQVTRGVRVLYRWSINIATRWIELFIAYWVFKL